MMVRKYKYDKVRLTKDAKAFLNEIKLKYPTYSKSKITEEALRLLYNVLCYKSPTELGKITPMVVKLISRVDSNEERM
jgi:hypothetical protein